MSTEPHAGVFVHQSSFVHEGAILAEGPKVWHFCHASSGPRVGGLVPRRQNTAVGNRGSMRVNP